MALIVLGNDGTVQNRNRNRNKGGKKRGGSVNKNEKDFKKINLSCLSVCQKTILRILCVSRKNSIIP